MSAQGHIFAAGFGLRLREERKRLGLSQEQFAESVGIKRLAQSQYEAETRDPRVAYLAAVGVAGADLYYLMFGKRVDESGLTTEQRAEIERRAFNLIEDYVASQCAGKLSGDGRHVLFQIVRSRLARALLDGANADISISDVMTGSAG